MSETKDMTIKDFDVKDIVKYLSDDHKLIIRDESQENEFWEARKTKLHGEQLKEYATTLESKISDLTKVPRNDGENSLSYLERTIEEINSNQTKTTAELDALRKSSAKGDSTATEIQKQFDTFKKAKEDEIKSLTGKVGEMEGAQFNNRIQNAVNEAMGKLRPALKKDKDNEKIVESAVQNEITRFYSEVKAVDHQGGLIYHDENDAPIIDKVSGNHLGAFDILSDRLNYLVDEKRLQGGAGTDPNFKPPSGDGEAKFKLELPDTVKSQVLLTEYIKNDKKVDHNSPEFGKYFQANKEGLSLR